MEITRRALAPLNGQDPKPVKMGTLGNLKSRMGGQTKALTAEQQQPVKRVGKVVGSRQGPSKVSKARQGIIVRQAPDRQSKRKVGHSPNGGEAAKKISRVAKLPKKETSVPAVIVTNTRDEISSRVQVKSNPKQLNNGTFNLFSVAD